MSPQKQIANLWTSVGLVNPLQLEKTRGQLHRAVQLVAAVGHSYLNKQADDSQSSVTWSTELAALPGKAVPEKASLSFALQPVPFKLLVLDNRLSIYEELALNGRTQMEAEQWIRRQLSGFGLDESLYHYDARQLEIAFSPEYDQPFTIERADDLKELKAWFANAVLFLQPLAEGRSDASPVRCWPHHFDIATLLALRPDADPEKITSISVGMTPGDSRYKEPYFYITPWPYPKNTDTLPALDGGGFWHTENWIGAVLTASQIKKNRDAQKQQQRVDAFLQSAVKACEEILHH